MEIIESMKDYIVNNPSQVWTAFFTLLSVIVGGAVTYLSTSSAEKRKYRRESQKQKLEQIYIPFCSCVEQTIAKVNELYMSESEQLLCTPEHYESCIKTLKEPAVYLEAAKRAYLTESLRKRLDSYQREVTAFEEQIEQDVIKCKFQYHNYFLKQFNEFHEIDRPMDISIAFSKNTELRLKLAIINRSKISLLLYIQSIDFIIYDDPENYQHKLVLLNNEAREAQGSIKYGYMSEDDYPEPEIKLACAVLDYIDDNFDTEIEELAKTIDKTQSADALRSIMDLLYSMKKDMIKMIDDVVQ